MTPPSGWPVHVVMDWPARGLSPNTRMHWAAKAKLVRAARGVAFWRAVHVGLKDAAKDADRLPLHVIFCPPDRRRRDLDNLIASLKATMDGFADALGCDDAAFVPTYEIGARAPGGCVCVTVHEPAREAAE